MRLPSLPALLLARAAAARLASFSCRAFASGPAALLLCVPPMLMLMLTFTLRLYLSRISICPGMLKGLLVCC